MTIIKKKIKEREYFYLEHSYREDSKVKKVSKYLGTEIPKNIDEIKSDIFAEINRIKWYTDLEKIKKNFNKEFKSFPRSGKEKYYENFVVKFTYNSNKIEGSTLTLKETGRLLEEGIAPANKPIKDVKEAESHKKVFNLMINEQKDLSWGIVLKWHRELFKNIDDEIAGKIRKHPVGIAGSKFEPPMSIELDLLLNEFFDWYKKNKKMHPVELAALVHLKFVTIHPFTDGNGRISRMIMNFILHKNGFPMLNIEYLNRSSYYTALERSQIKENERIFVQYLIKRYLKVYHKYV